VYPFIPQKNHDGCAISVLTMCLNYFGIYQNYNAIEANFINKNLSFLDIIEFLKTHNIKANALKQINKDLNSITNFPVILHLKNHYIIVYDRIGNKFVYADPAGFGIIRSKLLFKLKSWSGNYLDISHNTIKPPSKIQYHLPYNIRLFILNLILLAVIYQLIK
jgi:ABC-type bacteriocin/lantibiotic exporter with double-glycine peptidase domain